MCVCVTTALGSLLGESPLGCGCIPALRLMSLFHTISRFPINPSGEPVSPRPEGSCTGGSAGTRGASAPWRCQGPGVPGATGWDCWSRLGLIPGGPAWEGAREGPSRSAARARAPYRALPTIWVPQKPQLGVPGVSGSATPLSPSHASCVRETLFSLKTSGFV